MYLRIQKDKPIIYPYSPQQLRTDTGTMFEQEISPQVLAAHGVFPVVPAPRPDVDPLLMEAIELAPQKQPDGTWLQQWKLVQRYATQADRDKVIKDELARLQELWSDQIDTAAASASAKPQRFITEYLRREAQARGYLNDCSRLHAGAARPPAPPLVAGFALEAGMDEYSAAQLTVSQADKLYNQVDQLANLRMRKYAVKRATTIAAAQAAFDSTMADIRAVAATIT